MLKKRVVRELWDLMHLLEELEKKTPGGREEEAFNQGKISRQGKAEGVLSIQ